MLFSLKRLNRELKAYDGALYAQETKPGRVDIYRRNREMCSPPHFVFSLTDTWGPQGNPVPWGLDVILNRLRAHDLWNQGEGFIEKWISGHEEKEAAKQRDFRNSVESFLYDFRSQFHRATNEINTSTLQKIYPKGL